MASALKTTLAAVLAVVIAAAGAYGQCGTQLVGTTGGECTAAAYVGSGVVLTAWGNRVSLVGVSNPATPGVVFLRGSSPTVHVPANVIKLSATPGSGRAFALMESGEVEVLGISSNATPPLTTPNILSELGTLPLSSAVDVLAHGTLVHVARAYERPTSHDSSVVTYETSSSPPTYRGSFDPIASTYVFEKLALVGNVVWAGFHEADFSSIYGLTGFDFTNPAAPVVRGSALMNVPLGSAARVQGMAAVGNRVALMYTGGSNSNLRTIDVSNPSSPAVQSAVALNAVGRDLAAIGTQLHVALGSAGIRVLDGNASPPTTLGSLAVFSGEARQVAGVSGVDYVAAGTAGLWNVNTSTPSSMATYAYLNPFPATPKFVRTTAGNPATVAVYDQTLGMLRLYTAASPGFTPRGSVSVGTGVQAMELCVQPAGFYLCLVYSTQVQSININNPDSPVLAGSVPIPSAPSLTAASAGRLYVLDATRTLRVISVSNSGVPSLSGSQQYGGGSTDYSCMAAWTSGVALGGRLGVWLIDTTNAASPLVSGIWNPQAGYGVTGLVRGPTHLYVASYVQPAPNSTPTYALEVLNIDALTSPSLVWRCGADTQWVSVPATDLAYVGTSSGSRFVVGVDSVYPWLPATVRVFDVTNPAAALQIDAPEAWGIAGPLQPFAVGARLAAASDYAAYADHVLDGPSVEVARGVSEFLTPTQWAPAIVDQPDSPGACVGGTAVFALGGPFPVSASPATVTYRWYRNYNEPLTDGPTPWGSTITGAATPTLRITGVRASDILKRYPGFWVRNVYSCVVTNSCGGTRSSAVAAGPCPVDYTCASGADLLDIFAFLTHWFAANPLADYDGLNGVDLLDIFTFLGDWFQGCPA